MVEPLLVLENVSKRFESSGGLFRKPRSMMAVRNVSLSLPQRAVVGVVGESGCGKSTLGRLVMQLLPASQGSIRFDGVELTTLRARQMRNLRKRMQMVFQDPYSSLDPRYTVTDVLAEPFSVLGTRPPAGRIEHLLGQVGLSPAMATSYPHQLSGGQRQRVGIARALAHNPDFVVLDEPTASLDVSIQAQIIALLKQLQEDLGLTYLFISHDLGLVRYFCTRIVVMYLGAVVEDIPDPDTAPRHPYTRALMDSTFIPDPGRRREIAALEGEIPSAFNLPRGCPFVTRCPRAGGRCQEEAPQLDIDADGHAVACFHPL